jgi:anti-sigma factor RsiW
VKSAHDAVSCSLFRKLIMDYIDNELSDKVRSDFLTHSVSCPACCKELKELQYVKKALAGLPPATVSSEFDFRLKSSLRMEEARLRNPIYRMKLYLKENMASLVGVPVAAALLLGGMLLHNGPFQNFQPGFQAAQQKQIEQKWVQTSSVAGSSAEDVHYVLDSVDLSEVGTKAISNGNSEKKLTDANSINLIRY